jgi:hypothetical protein
MADIKPFYWDQKVQSHKCGREGKKRKGEERGKKGREGGKETNKAGRTVTEDSRGSGWGVQVNEHRACAFGRHWIFQGVSRINEKICSPKPQWVVTGLIVLCLLKTNSDWSVLISKEKLICEWKMEGLDAKSISLSLYIYIYYTHIYAYTYIHTYMHILQTIAPQMDFIHIQK